MHTGISMQRDRGCTQDKAAYPAVFDWLVASLLEPKLAWLAGPTFAKNDINEYIAQLRLRNQAYVVGRERER